MYKSDMREKLIKNPYAAFCLCIETMWHALEGWIGAWVDSGAAVNELVHKSVGSSLKLVTKITSCILIAHVGEKVNVTYDSLLDKIPSADENAFEKCLQYHAFLGKSEKKKKKEGKGNVCLEAGETRCRCDRNHFEFLNTPTNVQQCEIKTRI